MFGDKNKETEKETVTPEVVAAPVVETASTGNVAKIKAFKSGDTLTLKDVDGNEYNRLNALFTCERNSGKLRFEHDQDTCTLKVIDGDG